MAESLIARASTLSQGEHPRVVVLIPGLRHLLEPLQGDLPSHQLTTGADAQDADVFVTNEIDSAAIRMLRRRRPELVILIAASSAVTRALEHRTFVAAVNAGASAYLVDATVRMIATHIEHVGRLEHRRSA